MRLRIGGDRLLRGVARVGAWKSRPRPFALLRRRIRECLGLKQQREAREDENRRQHPCGKRLRAWSMDFDDVETRCAVDSREQRLAGLPAVKRGREKIDRQVCQQTHTEEEAPFVACAVSNELHGLTAVSPSKLGRVDPQQKGAESFKHTPLAISSSRARRAAHLPVSRPRRGRPCVPLRSCDSSGAVHR